LGIVPVDIRQPMDMRELIIRIVDASRLEEFKPLYGKGLITAWAHIHGTLLNFMLTKVTESASSQIKLR
jgi:acetyl-CoA carboxylase carboxyltransferase component